MSRFPFSLGWFGEEPSLVPPRLADPNADAETTLEPGSCECSCTCREVPRAGKPSRTFCCSGHTSSASARPADMFCYSGTYLTSLHLRLLAPPSRKIGFGTGSGNSWLNGGRIACNCAILDLAHAPVGPHAHPTTNVGPQRHTHTHTQTHTPHLPLLSLLT